MKFRNLLVTMGLALVASVGVAASLSEKPAAATKAEVVCEGYTFIDLYEANGSGKWVDSGAKFGVYYWNSETNAFSEFAVEAETDSHIYKAHYSLEFTPEHMKAVRFNSSAETPNWGGSWNETGNYDFYGNGYIGVWGYRDGEHGDWAGALSETIGLDTNVVLSNYKRNGSGHPEHFGGVTLAADDEFRIKYNGLEYHDYNLGDGVEASEFELTEGNKIKAVSGGTYEFYFDTTSYSLHIANPAKAAADEWAQSFLGANCTATKSGWESAKAAYNALAYQEAKDLIAGQTHIGHEEEAEGYVAQAVQRYDYVLERYGIKSELNPTGYEDFLGRVNAGKVVPGSAARISIFGNNINSTNITLIIITAVAALSIAAGLVLILKKKHK